MVKSKEQLGLDFDYYVDDKTKSLIGESWTKAIGNMVSTDFLNTIRKNLTEERKIYTIYPPLNKIFRAFLETPFDKVKVVLLGQDPYYNGVANGLAFATNNSKCPASLKVMLQAANSSLLNGKDFTLTQWTEQGVFLFNCQLTVRDGEANSHKYLGWHKLTKQVLRKLDEKKSGIVFVLLGATPRCFKDQLSNPKNLVIEVEHPAASLYDKRDWEGKRLFENINSFLEKNDQNKINF